MPHTLGELIEVQETYYGEHIIEYYWHQLEQFHQEHENEF